ncbi:MAG: UDP-galactopyranose mutase [Mogibacterium sp.]|nr:UDP-galactopyranose mutase [Mogibacterium sp.]
MNIRDHDRKYDYLVVGAGMYGAAIARVLTDQGFRVLVVERKDHIGGAAFTHEEDGIMIYDYGAHIFHTSDERVWDFVRRFADFREYIHEPKAFYKGKLYSLPFNMNTFREMWGITAPQQAKEIIEKQIAASGFAAKEPSNLEEQAIRLVGTDVYEKLIKGYTEKQWGRPCSELPASIIRRIPVRYEYNNHYFDDKYQGLPADGYTAMVSRMLDGVDVMTGTDFLDPANRTELTPLANRIIYSGQIDAYYGYCYGPLEYRGLRFETLHVPEEECFAGGAYQEAAVVNYTDVEVPWTRITEHKLFAEERNVANVTGSIITREYSAKWHPGEDAFYPVADDENRTRYEKYRKLAEQEKEVLFGGRLGSYRYMDMDDVIAAALSDAGMMI